MPRSIFGITKTYKNLKRLRTIVNVLLKHGFGQLVEQLNLQNAVGFGRMIVKFGRYQESVRPQYSAPERLRMVMEELGPCFVKFGQVLSTRPDIIPREFIAEFKKLQDDVPPFPFEEVKEKVEKELDGPLESLFSKFNQFPFASASIAQVHEAALQDGSPVVIKVQRPGIVDLVNTDSAILYNLAELMEKYIEESRLYQPTAIVEEFAESIKKEMNFTLEARNTDRFAHIFQDNPDVKIPHVYWDLSGAHILTLERLDGIPLDDVDTIVEKGHDPKVIAEKGGTIFLRMVLEHGFFHADPHPGNFLLADGGVIAMLDFGLVGRLEPEQKENLANLLIALITQDYDAMVQQLIALDFKIEEDLQKQFKTELRDLIEPYYGRELKNISMSAVVTRIVDITFNLRIRVPPSFLLLTRSIVILEGVGRTLDPEMDLVALGAPMATEIIQKRMHPKRIMMEMYKNISEINIYAKNFPKQAAQVLDKLKNDDLKINFFHSGLENLLRELDRLGNRVSLSLIIASLVIGSSLIIISDKGPTLLGYPAFGIIGYSLAGIIGIWLLVSILRSGRF